MCVLFVRLLLLMRFEASANGTVLQSEIVGSVKMRVYLTGMPELRLGLNDKVLFEGSGSKNFWRWLTMWNASCRREEQVGRVGRCKIPPVCAAVEIRQRQNHLLHSTRWGFRVDELQVWCILLWKKMQIWHKLKMSSEFERSRKTSLELPNHIFSPP